MCRLNFKFFFFLSFGTGGGELGALSVVRRAKGETRVLTAGAPEEMSVIGCIVGVTWIGGDRLQIRLLRRPEIVLRHPQKAGIFVVRLRIRRLHRYRSLEVLLSSVKKAHPKKKKKIKGQQSQSMPRDKFVIVFPSFLSFH